MGKPSKTRSKKNSAAQEGAEADVANGRVQQPATTSAHPSEQQQGQGAGERPVRVYADGIFDMFHFGHARALEQAKKICPNSYLIVGVCSDAVTHRYKGKTVMTEDERYESVRHCKWVDEVLMDAPWVITEEFLTKHNIDFVAHDDLPYADNSGQTDDVYGPVKRLGKFKATQRTEGVSTSDLILRILKDYNEYVLRNLSRGYSRKDLGISALKEQRIRASHNIKKLSTKVADRITKPFGLKRGPDSRGGTVEAAAAEGESSGGEGNNLTPSASKTELADLIRKNGEEIATSVEIVVEKIMRGEYGKEVGNAAEQLTASMDKLISGCFRGFEQSYNKLERAIRESMDWRKNGTGAVLASGRQRRRQTTLQLMRGGSSSSSDEDFEDTHSQEEEELDAGKQAQQQEGRPAKRARSGAAGAAAAAPAAASQPAVLA